MTIRVMLVDDSNVVRGLLTRALEQDASINIVANAGDGITAIEMAKRHTPDIIILDIEMPHMDGITAIPFLLEAAPNARIIMASRLTNRSASISMQALTLGAADYVSKPEMDGLEQFYRDLRDKIKALGANATVRKKPLAKPVEKPVAAPPQTTKPRKALPPTLAPPSPSSSIVQALAIASSTGGPQALIALFSGMKERPLQVPIFIAQHMPESFTGVLAEHIAEVSGLICTEGKDGEIAKSGHIYVAPGNHHMLVAREGHDAIIRINQESPVHFCRPSADLLFQSLSQTYGRHLLAVVLTGMGRDGADGAQSIVNNGGAVIAQNKETSIVYGMPKAVIDKGICQAILPLHEMAAFLSKSC